MAQTGETTTSPASATALTRPLGVVVADDNLLVREGIVHLLIDGGCRVLAAVGSAAELLDTVSSRPGDVDVCVIDMRMPPDFTDDGVRAARRIRERHPEIAVLVLSQYVDDIYAEELLQGHGERVGYLLKESVLNPGELLRAVTDVGSGGVVVDRAVVRELLGRQRRDTSIERLTNRERDVLKLMAEGCTDKAIAEKLFVSVKTVQTHVHTVFTKLEIPDDHASNRRVHAVLAWLRQ